MARARAVETRLERQLPAVDEFFTSGFLTKSELLQLTRTRTHWEYRLAAKPLLLLDIQNAVKYEMGLEERLRQHCLRTKVNLKHRWSILERIEYLYSIGIKHLKNKAEKETVRKEFVLFLKSFNRVSSLGKLYGQLMISFPTRGDIWVEAALWEGLERRNMDHARSIVQQALVTMSGDVAVWAAALKLELAFAERLMEGVLETHGTQQRKLRKLQEQQPQEKSKDGKKSSTSPAPLSQTLRSENVAMADLILGLALAKVVVEEALESPASGPELLKQLLAVCAEYGFSKEVAVAAVDGTTRKMYDVLVRGRSTATAGAKGEGADRKRGADGPSQLERTRWKESGLTAVLRSYLLVEELCVSEGRAPLRAAAVYLDEEAEKVAAGEDVAEKTKKKSAVELEQAHRQAATASLAALLAFAALPVATRAALGAGQSPQRVWEEVVLAGVAKVLQALVDNTETPPEAVSQFSLSLLLLPPNGLDEKTIRACLDSITPTGGKGKSAKQAKGAGAELVKLAQARVNALVEEAQCGTLSGGNGSAKRQRVDSSSGEDESGAGRWQASTLGRFLSASDRKALAAAHLTPSRQGAAAVETPSGGTAVPVTADDVDELLLWWRAEEKAIRGDERAKASEAGEESNDDAVRARLRQAAHAFFRRFGLLSKPLGEEEGEGNHKGHKSKKKAASSASRPGATAAANDFARQHPLLLLSNGMRFTDPKTTPLCLWRVFNALEVTEGSSLFLAQQTPPRGGADALTSSSFPHSPSSLSSSESDSDGEEAAEERGNEKRREKLPPHFESYAAAGVHFLATAQHGMLDRQGQLDRAVGLCALSRSHLYSLTGVKAGANAAAAAATRTELLQWLSAAPSSSTDETLTARLTDMSTFLELMELRCQPLPRQHQVLVAIPFFEAVATFLKGRAAASASKRDKAAADAAVSKARAAHEKLMGLYGFTKHIATFIPLVYYSGSSRRPDTEGGASASAASLQPKHTDFKAAESLVDGFNVEDWIAFVFFERNVAKDLDRSRAVTERARRACLAPQQLLVKLSNAGT